MEYRAHRADNTLDFVSSEVGWMLSDTMRVKQRPLSPLSRKSPSGHRVQRCQTDFTMGRYILNHYQYRGFYDALQLGYHRLVQH